MVLPGRTCNRLYSQSALEDWFGYVQGDWEAGFAEETLERGREIYVSGQISDVELEPTTAIVNCKFSRKDTCYAVIEWDRRKGLQVRASTSDFALGQAVAAAGLYEIEELVADEIPAIAFEAADAPRGDAPADAGAAADAEVEPVGRPLRLELFGDAAGLHLTAFWAEADGRAGVFSKGGEAAVPVERERLVRLTALAHEAGFNFRAEAHDFLLRDPVRIDSFLGRRLDSWKEIFGRIRLDKEAELMRRGIREVEVVAGMHSAGADTLQVEWRFRSGGKWLDGVDIGRLVRHGAGAQVVPGQGLLRVSGEAISTLGDWRSAVNGATCPRYMAFSLFSELGVGFEIDAELERWRTTLTAPVHGDEGVLPGFLRHYQSYGVAWLANLRDRGCHGLLADEMGLGKTVQVLALLAQRPHPGLPNLIVCPASVVPVWLAETERWFPQLRTAVLRSGNTFDDGEGGGAPDIWISSYTQLRRHRALLDGREFGFAVLDEAQQIKNPEAKVTHACCAIRARTRIALTGTPLENRLLDIWTLFRFLMPGLLGSRRRFEEAANEGSVDRRQHFEERLRRQLAPFVLRRTKDEVGTDLPPKIEVDLVCPISDLQRQVYNSLLARGREELGDDLAGAMREQAVHFFSLLTRLRQACCDPGLLPDVDADVAQSGKIQILLDKLAEALAGNGSRKIVIFSQFVSLLKRLKKVVKPAFDTVELLELTGSTVDRAKPVRQFQECAGPAIILVSLKAGGTGITLHAADYVFLLDPWWNPAVENQAVDRVHRIGQDKHVFVYRMITRGTIEERIQHLKREKRELFESTIGKVGKASDLKQHFESLQALAELLPDKSPRPAAAGPGGL